MRDVLPEENLREFLSLPSSHCSGGKEGELTLDPRTTPGSEEGPWTQGSNYL